MDLGHASRIWTLVTNFISCDDKRYAFKCNYVYPEERYVGILIFENTRLFAFFIKCINVFLI